MLRKPYALRSKLLKILLVEFLNKLSRWLKYMNILNIKPKLAFLLQGNIDVLSARSATAARGKL